MYDFGFIGVGHMGSIIAGSVMEAAWDKRVCLCDHNTDRLRDFMSNYDGVIASAAEAAASRYIFIGVKPQSLRKMFEEIGPVLKGRRDRYVLVTMAAGVSIAKLREMAGVEAPVLRIMPNTPAAVGAGCTLYCASGDLTREELKELKTAMKLTGEMVELPEELMDAGSVMSGCGPAYVYRFIIAMAKAGEAVGLGFDTALKLAESTVFGAAKLALESNTDPETLCDQVCSPGGTTIEGVKRLKDGVFDGEVRRAVRASYRRTVEISGQ